jgi:hypothetical protein
MMTSEQPLPLSAKNAYGRAFLYARQTPTTDEDREDVVLAAHTLALVIDRARALTPSGIGTDQFLDQFDGNDFDRHSFHRGVEFALSQVYRWMITMEAGR